MDYSSESASFLDTSISIRDGHLSTSLYLKNPNDLLGRQTQDMTYRVPFVIQYFPQVERLRHVLQSLQHVIDNEHLSKIIPMPPLLAFKQPPNLQQTIVRNKLSSLQDNIDHNTTQPCHGNLYKTCQTITLENTPHHIHGRYLCDSANVVYLIRCNQVVIKQLWPAGLAEKWLGPRVELETDQEWGREVFPELGK
eukprot:g37450.t1